MVLSAYFVDWTIRVSLEFKKKIFSVYTFRESDVYFEPEKELYIKAIKKLKKYYTFKFDEFLSKTDYFENQILIITVNLKFNKTLLKILSLFFHY